MGKEGRKKRWRGKQQWEEYRHENKERKRGSVCVCVPESTAEALVPMMASDSGHRSIHFLLKPKMDTLTHSPCREEEGSLQSTASVH